MQIVQVLSIFAFAGYISAQNVGNRDIPIECRALCAPVLALSNDCDRQFDDDDDNDPRFINCVCTAQNAGSLIPECEACVHNFDRDDNDRDNDVLDLVRSCAFTTASYTGVAVQPTPTPPGPGVIVAPGTGVPTSDIGLPTPITTRTRTRTRGQDCDDDDDDDYLDPECSRTGTRTRTRTRTGVTMQTNTLMTTVTAPNGAVITSPVGGTTPGVSTTTRPAGTTATNPSVPQVTTNEGKTVRVPAVLAAAIVLGVVGLA